MSDFTVGEPTEVPPRVVGGKGQGKYVALVAKVRALQNGQAIPLEFADMASAGAWTSGRSGYFRRQGVRVQRRRSTVYLTRLEQQS